MSSQESLRGSDEPDGIAARVGATRDPIGGVPLDRLYLTPRKYVFDDADVLVEDDQVARLRDVSRTDGLRATRPLSPAVQRVDRSRPVATLSDRHARLAARPRHEVRAPWSWARRAR